MLLIALIAIAAPPHPGGLDASGCHMNRKTGVRHCHRGTSAPPPADRPLRALGGGAYYPNCAAARAAEAAPVRAGDPGYNRRLDRDGDGIGCE